VLQVPVFVLLCSRWPSAAALLVKQQVAGWRGYVISQEVGFVKCGAAVMLAQQDHLHRVRSGRLDQRMRGLLIIEGAA
jgi:hypothetical protein